MCRDGMTRKSPTQNDCSPDDHQKIIGHFHLPLTILARCLCCFNDTVVENWQLMIAADDNDQGLCRGKSGLFGSLGGSPNIELSLASFARPARAATAVACVRTSQDCARSAALARPQPPAAGECGRCQAFAGRWAGRHESQDGPTLTSGWTGMGAWAMYSIQAER